MLFRKEAVSYQRQRLMGDISLAQPLSIKFTVGILATVAILIITFLFNAQYSRKETVRGFLMPNKGVIKSFATQGGIIDKLWVKEGDSVNKGQALATVIIQQRNGDGVELSEQLTTQLQTQLSLLSDEINQHQTLKSQELTNLGNRQQALIIEKQALQSQLLLSDEKYELLQGQQQYFNKLNTQGYVSNLDKERQQQSFLEAKQEQQNVKRLLLQHQNELTQVAFNITNVPQQYTLRINNIKRQQSEVTRQLAQTAINTPSPQAMRAQ
jgi:membrane fusion protein